MNYFFIVQKEKSSQSLGLFCVSSYEIYTPEQERLDPKNDGSEVRNFRDFGCSILVNSGFNMMVEKEKLGRFLDHFSLVH